MDQYLAKITTVWNDFISDALSKEVNLKKVVSEDPNLTLHEKNMIFRLHNTASENEKYGIELYNYCLNLAQTNNLAPNFAS